VGDAISVGVASGVAVSSGVAVGSTVASGVAVGSVVASGVGLGVSVGSVWAKTVRGAARELSRRAKVEITTIVFCQIFISFSVN
jgi:hypothetical protein